MHSLRFIPRWIALASMIVWLGCSNRGPKQPANVSVIVPAAGSQGSTTAGTGAAGQQAVPPVAGSDAGMSTDPPHIGPPAPIDGSMPLMDAALDAGIDDDDAGPWVPPEPTCVDGIWRLAPGFLVARHVDYVADRKSALLDSGTFAETEPPTLSSAGVACASATNKPRCRSALGQPSQLGRHLVTTEGDNVRVWAGPATRSLLGLLDTPSDALWYLAANTPYAVPCTASIAASAGGYTISGAEPVEGCYEPGQPAPKVTVFVSSTDGALREIRTSPDAGTSLCGSF